VRHLFSLSNQKGENVKLQPLKDRVIVQQLKAEEKTAGGIFIPESAQNKEQQGVVVAVAEGITAVKPGDNVIYAQYGGAEVTIDNQQYVILDIKDVLAVMK